MNQHQVRTLVRRRYEANQAAAARFDVGMNYWIVSYVDRRLNTLGVQDNHDSEIVVTLPPELVAAALVDEMQRAPWHLERDQERALDRAEKLAA